MRISVYGLGKLGLPLALVMAEAGHRVVGVDTSEQQIERVKNGNLWVEADLQHYWNQYYHLPSGGYFSHGQGHIDHLTTDGEFAAEFTDASFIIVPTPSDPKTQMFVNDYVVKAAESIGRALIQKATPHLVVVVSTVMPGSSENVIIPAIEKASGKKLNEGFYYCYSPEFIALGSVVKDLKSPDFILCGSSCDEASDMFRGAVNYVPGNIPMYNMSIVEAEIAKISLNTYVTMKISFANMLDELCESFDANSEAVTSAIGMDSRIGFRCLSPGPAFGGPCFPRDGRAFLAMAEKQGVLAELAEATININNRQIRRVIRKIKQGSKVGVIGLTYKMGTGVTEESFGMKLVDALRALQYDVVGYDPIIQTGTLDDLNKCDTLIFTLPIEPSDLGIKRAGKEVISLWK